jgi:hypothetical protein
MDRPDIDALLIGALYGELTPADEARLAAHLESHPADKSALEGMKATRDNVRASRIFEVQAEPPQAVSALLLQEAARRAPRRAPDVEQRESWFHRFTRSFMAHPAMAAAAMLVLVVGVAGTLYMRNGDHFADKTVAAPEATVTTERADNVAMARSDAQAPASDQPAAAAGSAYAVDLAQEQQLQRGKDAEKGEETAKADRKLETPKGTTTTTKPDPGVVDGDFAKAPKHSASKKGYVEVTTPDRQPKELDKNDEGGEIAAGPAYGTATGTAGGGRAGAPATTGAIGGVSSANGAPAAPPPPPPQVAAAPMDEKPVAKTTAPPPKPTASPSKVAKAPAQAPIAQPQQPPGPATDTGLLAWAKAQHRTAVAKVKDGDCGSAATLAVQVKNRAPDYYAQYMQGDRDLKACNAYINDAELRNESANSKQKATKRASDEPSPAPSKK